MGKYVNGVYVPDPGETDNRFASSVQPHSRPLDAPVNEDGSVVRSSRLAQRNANQQARMAAAANSPVANNVQQLVDAAQVAPAGAVGNDSPDIQKANLFAKKYAPALMSGQLKSAEEQQLADRTAMFKNQLMPKAPAKTINPNSSSDGMDTILGHFTSPQEEEKYRKASVAQQRILAVADAIRQIGNIYNTTRYAPSQKLNMPAEAVRQRYLQDKALRDQANQRIITYEQAKRAQDLRARQLENEAKYRERMFKHYDDQEKRLRDQAEAREADAEAKRDLDREKFEADKAFKEKKISLAEYNATTSRIRAVKSGRAGKSGNTYWDYDEDGKIHYYPNKTMWEQGVESHSRNQQQQEEFKTIDGYGETKKTYKKRSTASKAGENASNAQRRGGAMSNFSINRNKDQQKKGSNVSRFSIKK
jgi:hypothetical protein